MKLNEVTSTLTKRQRDRLDKIVKGTWSINPETQLIDVDGSVVLGQSTKSIPFNFGHVTRNFNCAGTNIESLQGAPQSVDGDFRCSNTDIKSLEHAPQHVGRGFDCFGTDIRSLVGAPQLVGGHFDCSHTNIKSLEHAPQHVGGKFICRNTNAKDILRVFFIDGVTDYWGTLQGIVRQYLPDRDVLGCQEALIEAGYKEYARL